MTNELVIQASPFAGVAAIFLPVLIEWIKDAPFVKGVTEKTKGKVLAVAALVAATCAFVTAAFTGNLDEGVLTALGATVQNFIVVFGVQELAYRHLWKPYQDAKAKK